MDSNASRVSVIKQRAPAATPMRGTYATVQVAAPDALTGDDTAIPIASNPSALTAGAAADVVSEVKSEMVAVVTPKAFLESYLKQHGLNVEVGSSRVERDCASVAEPVRNQYRILMRDHALSPLGTAPISSLNHTSPAVDVSSLPAANSEPVSNGEEHADALGRKESLKYHQRLHNNRVSARAARVYKDIFQRLRTDRLLQLEAMTGGKPLLFKQPGNASSVGTGYHQDILVALEQAKLKAQQRVAASEIEQLQIEIETMEQERQRMTAMAKVRARMDHQGESGYVPERKNTQ